MIIYAVWVTHSYNFNEFYEPIKCFADKEKAEKFKQKKCGPTPAKPN